MFEKLKSKYKLHQQEKRKKKIDRILWELYRFGDRAIEKIPIDDLKYLENSDREKGIKFRWFIDYTGEYLPRS